MKISLVCGVMLDECVDVLEKYQGSVRFVCLEKVPHKATLELTGECADPVAETKRVLRSTSFGKNLMFQIMQL